MGNARQVNCRFLPGRGPGVEIATATSVRNLSQENKKGLCQKHSPFSFSSRHPERSAKRVAEGPARAAFVRSLTIARPLFSGRSTKLRGFMAPAKNVFAYNKASRCQGCSEEASEHYGWQRCPGRIVIESSAHQCHWLDDAQTVRQAPAQQNIVP